MKALLYESSQNLRFCEQPNSIADNDNTLIDVNAVGICGSDMHAYLGHDERRPPPLILGHEAAGMLPSGARVTVNPLVVCETCDYCRAGRSNLCLQRQIISMPPRAGAFAEQLAIPPQNIVPLPNSLSLQQGSLAEPLACGHHTAGLGVVHSRRSLAECQTAVLGGGAIGLASALSLTARGAKEVWIADNNPRRRKALEKTGNFHIVTPEALPTAMDVVIDAVGHEQTRRQASTITAPGGVVVHIGLASADGGFDMRRLTLQEIVLVGSYTYTMSLLTACIGVGKSHCG
jgi:L-iditol 2-dehydrogenase